MESFLEKIDTCHSNSEKSSTTKKINMQLLDIHYLRIIHFTLQKTSMIIIEARLFEKIL